MPGVFKPLFGSQLKRDHLYARGLQTYWLFNEGAGNKVYDVSGNGYDGTITAFANPGTSTSGWGPGPQGGALYFDGVDDLLTISGSPTSGAAEFTIGAWVKYAGSPASEDIIGCLGAPGPSAQYEMYVNGGTPTFYVITTGYTAASITSTMTTLWDGAEHFVVGAYSGTKGFLDIYVDGVLTNGAFSGPVPAVVSTDTSTTYIHPNNGLVSSLFIYSRYLYADEIAFLKAFPYCMFEEESWLGWMKHSGLSIPVAMHHYMTQRAA